MNGSQNNTLGTWVTRGVGIIGIIGAMFTAGTLGASIAIQELNNKVAVLTTLFDEYVKRRTDLDTFQREADRERYARTEVELDRLRHNIDVLNNRLEEFSRKK